MEKLGGADVGDDKAGGGSASAARGGTGSDHLSSHLPAGDHVSIPVEELLPKNHGDPSDPTSGATSAGIGTITSTPLQTSPPGRVHLSSKPPVDPLNLSAGKSTYAAGGSSAARGTPSQPAMPNPDGQKGSSLYVPPVRRQRDLGLSAAELFRMKESDSWRIRREQLSRCNAVFDEYLSKHVDNMRLRDAKAKLEEDQMKHEWKKLGMELDNLDTAEAVVDEELRTFNLSAEKNKKHHRDEMLKLKNMGRDLIKDMEAVRERERAYAQRKEEERIKALQEEVKTAEQNIKRLEDSLSEPLLKTDSSKEPAKKADDIWNRRQIILGFALGTGVTLLLQTYKLIPVDHLGLIVVTFALIWLIGYIAFPFGIVGTTKLEKSISQQATRLVYFSLSVYVAYSFYLISIP